MNGSTLLTLIKYVAVLAAASIIGNWFLAEIRKARLAGAPWYKPYISAPGLLIVAAVLLPLVYWFLTR